MLNVSKNLKKHFSVLIRIISATAEALYAKRERESERDLMLTFVPTSLQLLFSKFKGHEHHYESNINKILSDNEISIFLIV
jgi:hypothetical protein